MAVAVALRRARPADLVELTKPRIVALVLVTVATGYFLAAGDSASPWVLVHALIGTALVAGGTSALNQVLERDVDALMWRTMGRPIPSGRVGAGEAAVVAWALALAGLAYLAIAVNVPTAAIAAATLVSYVFVYTPLKRRTSLATLVGAVPGALPIVGGWAAAGGVAGLEVWVLFWIVFLWQLPHFLALSWLYREDYERAALRMLSVGDEDGRTTFRNAAVYAGALFPVSMAPPSLGMSGAVYFAGAALLSGWFLAVALHACRARSTAAARRLFTTSLVYLPAILLLLLLDRAI